MRAMSDAPPPLTVRFRWTQEEFMLAYRLYLRATTGPSIKWCARALFVCTVLLAILYFGVEHGTWAYVRAALLIGFGALVLWLTGPGLGALVLRRYKKRPDAGRIVHMQFRDDALDVSTEGLAKSEVKWPALVRAVLAPEGALLFLTGRQYLYVSGSGFVDVAARERFDDLVHAHLENVRELN